MTISGPNDAYRVVWALGEFFFLIFVVFAILNTKFNRFLNDGVTVVWAPVFYLCTHSLNTATTTRPRHHTTPAPVPVATSHTRHHTTSTSPTTYHPNLNGLPRHPHHYYHHVAPSEKTTTTISGPNDTIRVIWALGEFFFKFYSLFF